MDIEKLSIKIFNILLWIFWALLFSYICMLLYENGVAEKRGSKNLFDDFYTMIVPICPLAVECRSGLKKISATIKTTITTIILLLLMHFSIADTGFLTKSTILVYITTILAYFICLIMNFHPIINNYLNNYSPSEWIEPQREKHKKET